MWAFAHSSRLRRRTAVRSRPRWGWRACRWASLRRFLTVSAEIIWLCKPIVAAAVWVAGLRLSWRWRCWTWRSWAGVVTRGLWWWSRLDVLPNYMKCLWRWLIVEKWTFNSRATALVDIPAVSMPIAHSLKTCDICGIVLCDKTAHFRVAFYPLKCLWNEASCVPHLKLTSQLGGSCEILFGHDTKNIHWDYTQTLLDFFYAVFLHKSIILCHNITITKQLPK